MRPSGTTAVASATISPAPPEANCARWAWCHSCATPSRALYMHIGETHRRLRNVVERMVNGEKRRLTVRRYRGSGGGGAAR